MSFHAVAWALDQQLPIRTKFTLVCLANYADAAGRCWPSQALIARQSGQSVRSVRRCLDDLERDGYITRRGRVRDDGGRTSDMVRLVRDGAPPMPDEDATEVDAFERTPPATQTGGEGTGSPTPPATQTGAPPASVAGAPGQAGRAEPVIEPPREEPPTEPGPAADAAGATTAGGAQSIVGAWLEACPQRPPSRVVGHLSREVKALLDEGHPHPEVLAAVQAWHVKGLHPASLPSVLHELRHRRPTREVAAAQQAAAMAARTPWTPPAPGTVRSQPHTPPMIGA